ncbi:MAG TPA: hypothetical protein VFQ44_09495 [Streptosporangiaceae bacterium]|nr:hypothetical protein [Streptosporangiaceae bacterium]
MIFFKRHMAQSPKMTAMQEAMMNALIRTMDTGSSECINMTARSPDPSETAADAIE